MDFVRKYILVPDPQQNLPSTEVKMQTPIDSIAPGTSLLKSNQPKVQGIGFEIRVQKFK